MGDVALLTVLSRCCRYRPSRFQHSQKLVVFEESLGVGVKPDRCTSLVLGGVVIHLGTSYQIRKGFRASSRCAHANAASVTVGI